MKDETTEGSPANGRRMNEHCPLCGASIREEHYPRHRAIVVDESDREPNHRSERRLCPECWNDLKEKLSAPVA